ncbi:hypothetical protein PV08_05077 [Exophiala spinifera]|uniref:FAD-binding FR-type domain-containing protein n=1 Tax=Exophiala spinifera TaxID=91928 RepID=A0A0D1ZYZ5_9EURO|nr:uncharacterized protein PV08_05077 [Exophiala spinifera]KIW17882.1 hypothetical protein PV08_05077 [Exophiala spinifera]
MLDQRHIQNMSDAKSLQHHWGYADRAIPCTNDAGSCSYLDSVYHSHDLGMLYCGILWASILGIFFVWGVARRLSSTSQKSPNTIRRIQRTVASFGRQYLLSDCLGALFGRVTRLQVLVLVMLTGYLTIWTFVGITYKKWVTPVKKMPGVYNTRTGLGPFADRVGVLAYALIPFSVLLSSRESLLSLTTGIPYQHFNFLHRWLGYIVYVQSAIHTIGWCVVEMRLYQPQPETGLEWIQQRYMIWGVIAMFLLTVIVILSTPWAIRKTGYEFFRKSHYVVAMLFVGACWGHWSKLNCYLISSLVVWLIDRGIRLARTGLLHYNYLDGGRMGFRSAKAHISCFPDDVNGAVLRLDFTHPQNAWGVGAHFYLCFPEVSIWQAHPFTPFGEARDNYGHQEHSYIIRAKKGATRTLTDLSAAKEACAVEGQKAASTTPVILTGPYGGSIIRHLLPDTNVLCVAGGTGVTFVLPVLFNLIRQPPRPDRNIEFIWAIRRNDDLAWIQAELKALQEARRSHHLKIRIHVTRETGQNKADGETSEPPTKGAAGMSSSVISSEKSSALELSLQHAFEEESAASRHPDLDFLVRDFVGTTVRGSTSVFASGPGGMVSDLRRIVADCNSGTKVWGRNERYDVKLICDDRLEW